MASLAPPSGAAVSSVALAYESSTGDMLLAAGSGAAVVLWRLAAAAPPHVQRIPVYAQWALDSTLSVGADVHSVSLSTGDGMRVAVGTSRGVAVYEKSRMSWHLAWRTGCVCADRSPRGILCVRWSPDAQLLAALPATDTRVAIWDSAFRLVGRLNHTRPVHTIVWRRPSDKDSHMHALITITTDGVARVFAAPQDAALRQVAAVDAAVEGDSPTCRTLSTVYIDTLSARAACRGDLLAAAQQEQNAAAGVGTIDKDDAQRVRRIEQLLHTPDFFLSVLADASLVVHAVGALDTATPTLAKTQVLLRIPMCLSQDAAATRMHLELLPLPPSAHPWGALVHAQSLSGAHGSLALAPGYLFDGDLRGVVVRHAGARLLCAAHAAPVVSLSTRGARTCSLSSDGHVILWSDSLASLQSVTVRGAVAVCVTAAGFAVATADVLIEYSAGESVSETARRPLRGEVLALGGAQPVVVTTRGIYAAAAQECAVDAACVAPDGRVYTVHDGVLSERCGRSWRVTASLACGHAARLIAHNRCVAAAADGRVRVWDMARCEFSSPLMYDGAADGPLCWAADGRVLAVGVGADIDLYTRAGASLVYAARVGVHGTRSISHLAAVGASLVVASGCSLAVHALSSPPAPSLPLDDAVQLRNMLQLGMVDAADATLRVLMCTGDADARVAADAVPLETLLSRDATARMSGADADRIRALFAESPERLRAAEAVWDVQRASLDDCARRCLAAMRAAPGSGCTLWGAFSAVPEALVSAAQLQHERFTWEAACATGAVYWAPPSQLAELLEQAARAAFADEEPDVVLATLLYLVIGRIDTVRAVWRRAIGHPERQKMTTFLANDFGAERWRVAAQKNAFALISQRRFAFAAAFFVLGGAAAEAANLSVRQMDNVPLAVAIARMDGAVLPRLLADHVMPAAVQRADRWLACWVLRALGRERDIAKMITAPLASLASDASFEFRCEPLAQDVQDPSLAPLLEHALAQGWSSLGDVEARFVLFMQRQLAAQGALWLTRVSVSRPRARARVALCARAGCAGACAVAARRRARKDWLAACERARASTGAEHPGIRHGCIRPVGLCMSYSTHGPNRVYLQILPGRSEFRYYLPP